MAWMPTTSSSPGLTQLLWFVRIVDAGSFAEAARRSGTSTSAVSKALTRFERTYGVRLLHRTTHSLSLTDEGERLLIQGRPLLYEMEQVEASLLELGSHGATGRVRISAPTSFARSCLMPQLPAFLRKHPGINIDIYFGDEMGDLAALGIDLAIRSGEFDGLPGHVSRELFKFPWIACATPEYLAAHGTPATPADLIGHQQIGFRNKRTGQIDAWRFVSPENGQEVRHQPRPNHVFDEGGAAWSMVRAGFGIGWAPAWLGLQDLRDGNVMEVLNDWRAPESSLSAVRLERRLTPLRTQLFIEFLLGMSSDW
jgi:DNA-binding transcriptional LysR family regulator